MFLVLCLTSICITDIDWALHILCVLSLCVSLNSLPLSVTCLASPHSTWLPLPISQSPTTPRMPSPVTHHLGLSAGFRHRLSQSSGSALTTHLPRCTLTVYHVIRTPSWGLPSPGKRAEELHFSTPTTVHTFQYILPTLLLIKSFKTSSCQHFYWILIHTKTSQCPCAPLIFSLSNLNRRMFFCYRQVQQGPQCTLTGF